MSRREFTTYADEQLELSGLSYQLGHDVTQTAITKRGFSYRRVIQLLEN